MAPFSVPPRSVSSGIKDSCCRRPSATKERAGNNFPILVVGTLRVPYTSYGTRSVPTTLEQWHIGKLFLARSQRGIAATKEVVNAMVYNFSASCVEVDRIESKYETGLRFNTEGGPKYVPFEALQDKRTHEQKSPHSPASVMSTTRNWTTVAESKYTWEQDALSFVRQRFPSHEPYRAWSNFEFIAGDGSVNEVDLLVFGPMGFFLVEIKSRPGKLVGDAGTWTWETDGKLATFDNPLIAANLKAKKLRSLLQQQRAAQKKGQIPFVEPLIFCSAPD